MSEIVIVYDKWTDKKLAKMSLEDLRKKRSDETIVIDKIQYKIVETRRVPKTEESHNDTFFTYVFVESPLKTRDAILHYSD